jgi:AAA family ATP:ADP antiporter
METQHFGKWRKVLWPIHNYELKKLLPMLMLFFFISFNYSVLRNVKDSLIVTAPGSNAETIPFLKFWGVIPAAIIFMVIFSKLSNTLSKPKLFYVSLLPFIIFFVLFDMVLYPTRDHIHPHQLAEQLQATLPGGLHGFIAMCRNWSFSLFYIFAELWGSVALSLLFWGFANDTTKISEAKRFYALFGIGANIALEVAGHTTQYFADLKSTNGIDQMQLTLNGLTFLFVISMVFIVAIYWWINRYVLTDPKFFDPTKIKQKSKKPKMSLSESFSFLLKSKYLFYIAILVIAYGISINLIEVTWKEQLKLQYPTANEYLSFMGSYNTYVARTTIFMMLFLTGNVIRVFGWGITALITPVVLLVTGAGFFGLLIFGNVFADIITNAGTTALAAAVFIGTIQNVISKSSKYSLFDPTKEMTYIPLDQESKVKGKAAIDVVGARLGKAGGSVIQQGLFMIGPLATITSYIAVTLLVIIMAWIYATTKLNEVFKKQVVLTETTTATA